MKKAKLIAIIFVVASIILCANGCANETEPPHEHKYSAKWTYDTENHWHEATCEHTNEVSEKSAHTFGEYVSNNDATPEADGTKTRECSVCKYKDTVKDEGSKIHVHTYSVEWTYDTDNHWHKATCEHTSEVSDKAAHTLEWEITKNPTETEVGEKKGTCSVCGYETSVVTLETVPSGFVYVLGTTITGTETWTSSSEVFISGRQLTIRDLIVSDHEVTRGEYKEVIGIDPSETVIAGAYDKDGNELTGDDVLNNPVNKVSWYDAIVYCNKLSIQENLTPCYSIEDETDPEEWGDVPTSNSSTWNAVTCDFEANGYRLPTQAEWEWIACGGEEYEYAGSDNINDVAWYSGNTDNGTGTREVKTKAPNGYGLYDMSGNVIEWCWDKAGIIDESTPVEGPTGYSDSRIRRGGSFGVTASKAKVFYYNDPFSDPYYRHCGLGFRMVRSSTND